MTMRLRQHLILLILAATIPFLIFMAAMTILLARDGERRAHAELARIGATLSTAIDREAIHSVHLLSLLANSELLDGGDVEGFRRQATRALAGDLVIDLIVLTDPSGQQLMNTGTPPGAALPSIADRPYFRAAVARGEPVVSPVMLKAKSRGVDVLPLAVPVYRDGVLRYVLVGAIRGALLSELFFAQDIAPDWTGTFLDGNGTVIGRSRAPERFVGQRAPQGVLAATGQAPRGSFTAPTLDHIPSVGAFQRSLVTGWTIVIGRPVAEIRGAMWAFIERMLGGGALFAAVALFAALGFARRLSNELLSLAAPARALSQGRWVAPARPSSITEIAALSCELGQAAALLQARSAAREAAERELEIRVAQQNAVATLSQLALDGSSLDALFQRATEVVARTLDVEFCKLLERDADGSTLTLRAGVGWRDGLIGAAKVEGGLRSQAGYALVSDGPVVVENLALDTRFYGATLLAEHGVVSGISVIVRGKDGPWGVLGAHTARARKFSGDDVSFVQSVAYTLSSAIASAQAERERAATEEHLRQSQKMEMVGQLTGGVAHDFNNLLQVILGNAETLEEELADQPYAKSLASLSKVAAQRGAALTQRLLAFSRRQPLAPSEIDLNRLVGGVRELLGRTLGEAVTLETVLGADPCTVMADKTQLEAAILNLAVNARDAMPRGGTLTIATANVHLNEVPPDSEGEPGDYVTLAVTDTGTGMPPEVLARVFEPFFTTKDVGKGTGLGLSMVYGFIRQSGGHVRIVSERGRGTTVTLYLPSAPEDGGTADEDPFADGGLPRGSESVLIVEDDEQVRDFVVTQVRGLGYRVTAAADGHRALAALAQAADTDLLFTDVVMPGGMTGRQLAAEAQWIRPGLKVLYTSGYNDNIIGHEPGQIILRKPYRKAELARKLRQALDAGTDPGR